MHAYKRMIVRLALSSAVTPILFGWPAAVAAQANSVTLPALPLADALARIATATGTMIDVDPDAVRGLTARPVRNAHGAEAAVRQAIRGISVALMRREDGALQVVNDIVVQARRDEAEDNLLVRQATTSARTGETLRDQPRNAQVISSKLIEEQQALSINDALRNGGGVTVNNTTVMSGATYSVRGFAANGIVNGLPTAAGAVAVGATQPIANVERLEVLKGPDALLVGADNLGGTVNIVTKKPSVEPLLSLEANTGSYGLRRFVLDANRGLDEGKRFSARVIGSASDADRNWGGYRGNSDWLFAPSLRYKGASTDVIVGATVGSQSYGVSPYAVLNPTTNTPYDIPRDRPVIGGKDQGITIGNTQFYGEATHKPASWLTLVARAQHAKLSLDIDQYGNQGLFDPAGVLVVGNTHLRQEGDSTAADGYARLDFATGPFTHRIIGGYTWVGSKTEYFSSASDFVSPIPGFPFPTYNFLTRSPALPLLPAGASNRDLGVKSNQYGIYGQYLLKFWKLSLVAGVRNNRFNSTATNYFFNPPSALTDHVNYTVPNYGAVVDVTEHLSVFGSLAYGYIPVAALGSDGRKLPDTDTRNAEAGIKLDLFGKRALINASWFQIRQSNLIVVDPASSFAQKAVPGQQGTGIDLNVTGELLPGWQVMGSFTRIKYRYLTPSDFGNEVVAQPRDQYSLYTSYRHSLGEAKVGAGAGLYGRSSAAANSFGSYFVPPARQVDVNGFLEWGKVNVNLGVRNLFDRVNYGVTYTPSYLPISEPRTWRLTVGYRFQ